MREVSISLALKNQRNRLPYLLRERGREEKETQRKRERKGGEIAKAEEGKRKRGEKESGKGAGSFFVVAALIRLGVDAVEFERVWISERLPRSSKLS